MRSGGIRFALCNPQNLAAGVFFGFVANHTIDVGNVLGMINQNRLVVSIIFYFHPYLGK